MLSVDYRLAPESTLDDAVADALTGLGLLAGDGFERLFLCGDSAGGAVAIRAAAQTHLPLAGLLLTNPNVDLTLASFDAERPGGPDRRLSAWSSGRGPGSATLPTHRRLELVAERLPGPSSPSGRWTRSCPRRAPWPTPASARESTAGSSSWTAPRHGFAGTDRVTEALAAFGELTGLVHSHPSVDKGVP